MCCLTSAAWQVFGPWASLYGANGQITMTLHNYRSRQVHEILNGVNPSSSFRDMRSAGPNLWQIWQVFGPWASLYGAKGQMTMTVNNYRPRQLHKTSNGENPLSGYRDMGSASLAAARPPGTMTTIPFQPEGLRGKNCTMCFTITHSHSMIANNTNYVFKFDRSCKMLDSDTKSQVPDNECMHGVVHLIWWTSNDIMLENSKLSSSIWNEKNCVHITDNFVIWQNHLFIYTCVESRPLKYQFAGVYLVH